MKNTVLKTVNSMIVPSSGYLCYILILLYLLDSYRAHEEYNSQNSKFDSSFEWPFTLHLNPPSFARQLLST